MRRRYRCEAARITRQLGHDMRIDDASRTDAQRVA
jgi:hypothetical protein